MKPEGAEGLATVYRVSPAANEERTGMANAVGRLARPLSGWDPYEVWRTRVKELYTVTQERADVGTRPSLLGATQTAYRFIRSALETSRGHVRHPTD
jgi:hypothetical protein